MKNVKNNFEIKKISKDNHIFLVNSNEENTKLKKPALFFDRMVFYKRRKLHL